MAARTLALHSAAFVLACVCAAAIVLTIAVILSAGGRWESSTCRISTLPLWAMSPRAERNSAT